MASITAFPVPDQPSDPRDQFGSDAPILLDLPGGTAPIVASAPRSLEEAEADSANAARLLLAKRAQQEDRTKAVQAILPECKRDAVREQLLATKFLCDLMASDLLPSGYGSREMEFAAGAAYRLPEPLWQTILTFDISQALYLSLQHFLHDHGIHGELVSDRDLRTQAERLAGQALYALRRTLVGDRHVGGEDVARARLGFLKLTETV
jgi:hypothetical protein